MPATWTWFTPATLWPSPWPGWWPTATSKRGSTSIACSATRGSQKTKGTQHAAQPRHVSHTIEVSVVARQTSQAMLPHQGNDQSVHGISSAVCRQTAAALRSVGRGTSRTCMRLWEIGSRATRSAVPKSRPRRPRGSTTSAFALPAEGGLGACHACQGPGVEFPGAPTPHPKPLPFTTTPCAAASSIRMGRPRRVTAMVHGNQRGRLEVRQ
jgi:hypothetical protein